jgi:periplasmic divalent cation tolerance protein
MGRHWACDLRHCTPSQTTVEFGAGSGRRRRLGQVTDYRYCQVVTTTDTRDEADRLARTAVTARVAACAQVVGPVTSVFWWEGAVDTAEEWQVWFKTTTAAYASLEQHLCEAHSYDVPEILCLPVTAGHRPYLDWMDAETRNRS